MLRFSIPLDIITAMFKEQEDLCNRIDINALVKKYKINQYVKKFEIKHLTKIMILFIFSRYNSFYQFIKKLLDSRWAKIVFGIPSVCIQQVYKALDKKTHNFFRELFFEVIKTVRPPKKSIKIIDSTFIEIIAKRVFFSKKGYSSLLKRITEGIKIHVLYDLLEEVIENVNITSGNVHDIKMIEYLIKTIKKGDILLFDKGYFKLKLFKKLCKSKNEVFFITPMRKKIKYKILESKELIYSLFDNEKKILDQKIQMSNRLKLRLITFEDGFQILLNNFDFDVFDVQLLYSCRWSLEQLFKELKSYLKIDKLICRNYNAALIQIYMTLLCNFILKKIKEKLRVNCDYTTILNDIECELKTILTIETCMENSRSCSNKKLYTRKVIII
jgi:Transposase DDE domain